MTLPDLPPSMTTPAATVGPDTTTTLVVIAALVLLLLGVASVRVVAAHERAVVLRWGRVVRVRGPGLVVVLPGVERAVRVSLRASRLDPLVVRAVTRDGVAVRVWARALCRVVEPARSTVSAEDPMRRAAEAVEAGIRREVADTDLASLLTTGTPQGTCMQQHIARLTADWGVEVLEIETTDVELRAVRGPAGLGPTLGRPDRQGRRARPHRMTNRPDPSHLSQDGGHGPRQRPRRTRRGASRGSRPRPRGRRIGLPTIPLFMLAGIVFGPHTPGVALVDNPGDLDALRRRRPGLPALLPGSRVQHRRCRLSGRPPPARGRTIYLVLNVGGGVVFGSPWAGDGAKRSCWPASWASRRRRSPRRSSSSSARLSRPESRLILGIIVIEDVFLAVYLAAPAAGARRRRHRGGRAVDIGTALAFLARAGRLAMLGSRLLSALVPEHDDELLVVTFAGLALLTAGTAQHLGVSDAIGAFMIGLALGTTRSAPRIRRLVHPLRDTFAAVLFVAFGLSIDPADLATVAIPSRDRRRGHRGAQPGRGARRCSAALPRHRRRPDDGRHGSRPRRVRPRPRRHGRRRTARCPPRPVRRRLRPGPRDSQSTGRSPRRHTRPAHQRNASRTEYQPPRAAVATPEAQDDNRSPVDGPGSPSAKRCTHDSMAPNRSPRPS